MSRNANSVSIEIDYDYSISDDGVNVTIGDDSFDIDMSEILEELNEDQSSEIVSSMPLKLIVDALNTKFVELHKESERVTDQWRAATLEKNNLRTQLEAMTKENASLKSMVEPAHSAVIALEHVLTNGDTA